MASTETSTVPLFEEELRVAKEAVVTGRVRIRTPVETVEEVAQIALSEESVEVTRVAVDREVETVPQVRQEGDVTVIPIIEEVMVVEKRLVLKEELHVRRIVTQDNVEVPVTLRRQRGVIERVSADPSDRDSEEAQR